MQSYKIAIKTGYCLPALTLILMISPFGLAGCQLFHNSDSGQRNQAVTVTVTVPTDPTPPTVQPVQTVQPVAAPVKPPKAKLPISNRLMPKEGDISPPAVAISPLPATPQASPANRSRSAILKADTTLSNRVLTEDMVLKGAVLIKGDLVVAPHTTLRIEPGTVIRFSPALPSTRKPKLVVQGRIVCAGQPGRPITLTSVFDEPLPADWGGVVLLSTEKKNSFDHCLIEGAEAAIEARHSSFSAKTATISRSTTGIVLYDSSALLVSASISRTDTGIHSSNSELDLRDSLIKDNRTGLSTVQGSFSASSTTIRSNSQDGLTAEMSRFRLTNCSLAENRSGATLNGGDGQINLTRFTNNRENGLNLIRTRIRISGSSFLSNRQNGILLDNARGLVTGSSFLENRESNILNIGKEPFAAMLNWWGSTDEQSIATGIKAGNQPESAPMVQFTPFLASRPPGTP